MSNGIDPDQGQHSVGLDLGPNCLKGCQQMTKVAVSKERVGHTQNIVLSELYFLLGQMLKNLLPAKKA